MAVHKAIQIPEQTRSIFFTKRSTGTALSPSTAYSFPGIFVHIQSTSTNVTKLTDGLILRGSNSFQVYLFLWYEISAFDLTSNLMYCKMVWLNVYSPASKLGLMSVLVPLYSQHLNSPSFLHPHRVPEDKPPPPDLLWDIPPVKVAIHTSPYNRPAKRGCIRLSVSSKGERGFLQPHLISLRRVTQLPVGLHRASKNPRNPAERDMAFSHIPLHGRDKKFAIRAVEKDDFERRKTSQCCPLYIVAPHP